LPGLFSALGLLFSGIEHHDVRSCLLSGAALTAPALRRLQVEMMQALLAQFASEGIGVHEVSLYSSVDVRFRGQASEVRIAIDPPPLPLSAAEIALTEDKPMIEQLCAAFASEHERLYGHRSDPENPVEVVAVRLVGRAVVTTPESDRQATPFQLAQPTGAASRQSSRLAYFGERAGLIATPVITRRDLVGEVAGPLLIDENDSTTVVPPGVFARCDEQGNVVMGPV
jgi:N-methylhydantoinase A